MIPSMARFVRNRWVVAWRQPCSEKKRVEPCRKHIVILPRYTDLRYSLAVFVLIMVFSVMSSFSLVVSFVSSSAILELSVFYL